MKNYIITGALGILVGILMTFIFQASVFGEEDSLKNEKQVLNLQYQAPEANIWGLNRFDTIRKMQDQIIRDFESMHNFGEDFLKFDQNRLSLIDEQNSYYTLNKREDNNSVIYELILENNIEGSSVNVTVEEGLVKITGKKSQGKSNTDSPKDFYYLSNSTFSQAFTLPENVKADNVNIKHSKNKITLTFEKKPQFSQLTTESEYSL